MADTSRHWARTDNHCMRMRELSTGRVFDHNSPPDSKRLVEQGTHEYVPADTPLTDPA